MKRSLVATLFAAALFTQTSAAIRLLLVDVRIPSLAPTGLKWRALCAILAIQACSIVPIANDSFQGLYVSVFGLLLPMLILMWLTALWLLRAITESLLAHR